MGGKRTSGRLRWRMGFKSALLRLLGFRSMVLIHGRSFADLSQPELAEMIEVHLGGRGRFDPDALYEFLCMEYQGLAEEVRVELESIDREFASSATEIDGLDSGRGRAALDDLARRLRQGRFSA